jgi:threonine/homoserine/homoserine lactone efflux protein
MINHWWAFLVASFAICGTPGPNMLMMLAGGIRHGLRRTAYIMAGCYLAVIALLTASALGLGGLLVVRPMLFRSICVMGALYLLYLGLEAWRAPALPPTGAEEGSVATPAHLFRRGFQTGISNPKALLFAAAFFPQFMNPQKPILPQCLMLLAAFSVIEIGWYIAYAASGSRLAGYLGRESSGRAFNRVTGALFAFFGLMLLGWR